MISKNSKLNSDNADKNLLKSTAVASDNESNGYLKIRVVTELGDYPIDGATVTVYASLDELVPVQTVTTDSTGYAPLITLPVSYNANVEEMDSRYYYTDYNLNVEFTYYYPTLVYDIQVFPGVTTELVVNMTHIPPTDAAPYGEKKIVIPKIPR